MQQAPAPAGMQERGFPHNGQLADDAVYGGLQPSARRLLKRAVMMCQQQIMDLDGGITAIARVIADGGHPDANQDELRTRNLDNMQSTITSKQSYQRGLQFMVEAFV